MVLKIGFDPKLQYRRISINSRNINTVFQNTTGSPLIVSARQATTNGNTMLAQTDANNPPTTTVASTSNGLTGVTVGSDSTNITLTFIVLPNNFYRLNSAGGGTATASEWS